jgi:hypothetical protein
MNAINAAPTAKINPPTVLLSAPLVNNGNPELAAAVLEADAEVVASAAPI